MKSDFSPLLKLAIPLCLTGMLNSSTFVFQTAFLAHVSQKVLAASALAGWLYGVLIVILFGILSSINILVAHKHGADDRAGITHILRDGVVLSFLISIPSTILLWNLAPIFLVFGQSPALVPLTAAYFHALAWGVLPNFVMVALLEFVIGIGHAKVVTIFTILSGLLTVLFSYALILGKLGMPHLAIAGAGWATTISSWITVIVLIVYVLRHCSYTKYVANIFSVGKTEYLWELTRIGFPMGLMYCFEVAFFFAVILILGSFGTHLIAANQVAMQYFGFFIGIVFSIAQAITVRMGHLIGAKDLHAADRAFYTGLVIVMSIIGVCALSFWLIPTVFISIDFDIHNPNNAEIVYFAKQFLSISAVFLIIESVRISLFGALRGLKDTRFPLFITIISFWFIALPFGYLLATYFDLAGAGLWWGMVLGAIFSSSVLYARFRKKMHHYKLNGF